MQFPSITHHGGVSGVTGSCHQLHLRPAISLLIDCGLEQGVDAQDKAGACILGFAVEGIQALVVTHVHLDHVGRIPALLAAGFRGPILCSEPSAALLPLVLEDAFKVGISTEPGRVARYLDLIKAMLVPLPFDQWHSAVEESDLVCAIRLRRAGHLLGSAYVECDIQTVGASQRIVFSGDLGPKGNPILRPVQAPEPADVLVLESTYGDRLHADRSNRRVQLERLIDRALQDRGTILFPAFSLGRTQELLFELEDILHRKALLDDPAIIGGEDAFTWSQLPIILDSPLAQRITRVYRDLHDYWSDEARARISQGREPMGFSQLVIVDTHARHRQVVNYLRSTVRPAIVIAGNGMCAGGRVVSYLKAMLADPRHEVVFVGHQAYGTSGAVIQAGGGKAGVGQVELDGELYRICAKVVTLSGYSGHADQAELVEFAVGCEARKVVLVHGEWRAKKVLAEKIRERFARSGKDVAVAIGR